MDHFLGVFSEYSYLTQNYGIRNKEWKLVKQTLLEHAGKMYDMLEIQLTRNESIKTIYFDISDFYGKGFG